MTTDVEQILGVNKIFTNYDLTYLCSIPNFQEELQILVDKGLNSKKSERVVERKISLYELKAKNIMSKLDAYSQFNYSTSLLMSLCFNLIITKNTGSFLINFNYISYSNRMQYFIFVNMALSICSIYYFYKKMINNDNKLINKYKYICN